MKPWKRGVGAKEASEMSMASMGPRR